MKREEVKAKTRVDWYYIAQKDEDDKLEKTHVGGCYSIAYYMKLPVCVHVFLSSSQIYKYEDDVPEEVDGPFKGRLTWNGSQDLQEMSIRIKNVTFNDSGLYECHVLREFEFGFFSPTFFTIKNITLNVKEKGAAI